MTTMSEVLPEATIGFVLNYFDTYYSKLPPHRFYYCLGDESGRRHFVLIMKDAEKSFEICRKCNKSTNADSNSDNRLYYSAWDKIDDRYSTSGRYILISSKG